jgi:DNA polymerase V
MLGNPHVPFLGGTWQQCDVSTRRSRLRAYWPLCRVIRSGPPRSCTTSRWKKSGVLAAHREKLNIMGIENALQLSRAHPAFIRKNFSVVLERTVRELNGESCIPLEEFAPAKQQIVCSRSFGERITSKVVMQQALCQYATRASVKLRGERQFCRRVGIFIRTSPHAPGEVFYGNSAGEILKVPTQDTRDVIEVAMRSLDRIWLEGRRYIKAGIMLDDFTPNGVSQLNLFDEDGPRRNSAQLMKVLDGINQSGLGNLWFAGQGLNTEWKMKREMLSPAWTTRWSDIPVAHVK